jgi:hypothetical protein
VQRDNANPYHAGMQGNSAVRSSNNGFSNKDQRLKVTSLPFYLITLIVRMIKRQHLLSVKHFTIISSFNHHGTLVRQAFSS